MADTGAEDLINEIQSQIKTMESRRLRWERLWKDTAEFCYPTRVFDPIKDQDAEKTPKINYNNRAALDVSKASAGFQGYTANRRSVWAVLQFEDQDLMKAYGVADWLEKCLRTLFATFGRNGLYEGLGEMVPDGHVIGTAVMYIEDVGDGKIAYQTRHPLSVWISENAYGEVDTVCEDIAMTNRAIADRFGLENLTDRRQKAAKERPYEMSYIRHLVRPKDERFKAFQQSPIDDRMEWSSIWYDLEGKKILDVGGYWEFPYAVWRYKKNAGEEYGRCPGHDALGDVMVSQNMTKSLIKLGNRVADPAYIVDKELEGQDTLLPGSRIYRDDSGATIEQVDTAGNYPITKDNEARQDALIDEHFSIPIYQMLQMMEREMTAREVIERTGEKAAILGPTTGRYEKEVLQVVIKRSFALLYRAGKLPPAPQAIIDAGAEAVFKIEFMGMLAQLQQRYYQTNGINSGFAFAQAVIASFPESADWIDSDRIMVEGLESAGTPASVIREEDDVKKLRQMRIQQQQQAAQQQAAQQQDETLMNNMDKLGKKPEDGSPLQAYAQQQAQQQQAQPQAPEQANA